MLSRTVSNTLDTKLSKVVNKILLEKTSSWGYGLFGGNKMQSGSEQVQINSGLNDYERRFHQVSNNKHIKHKKNRTKRYFLYHFYNFHFYDK